MNLAKAVDRYVLIAAFVIIVSGIIDVAVYYLGGETYYVPASILGLFFFFYGIGFLAYFFLWRSAK